MASRPARSVETRHTATSMQAQMWHLAEQRRHPDVHDFRRCWCCCRTCRFPEIIVVINDINARAQTILHPYTGAV